MKLPARDRALYRFGALSGLVLMLLTGWLGLAEFTVCLDGDGRIHSEVAGGDCRPDADEHATESDDCGDCIDVAAESQALRNDAGMQESTAPLPSILPPDALQAAHAALVATDAPPDRVDPASGRLAAFRDTIVLTC